MSVGPVSQYNPPRTFNRPPQAAPVKNPVDVSAYKPKEVARAKFDPGKRELNVILELENTFDSQKFYKIKEDGSAECSTCWKHKAAVYQPGALKDVYEEAKASYEKNGGVIPEEDAKVLAEKIKEKK